MRPEDESIDVERDVGYSSRKVPFSISANSPEVGLSSDMFADFVCV